MKFRFQRYNASEKKNVCISFIIVVEVSLFHSAGLWTLLKYALHCSLVKRTSNHSLCIYSTPCSTRMQSNLTLLKICKSSAHALFLYNKIYSENFHSADPVRGVSRLIH